MVLTNRPNGQSIDSVAHFQACTLNPSEHCPGQTDVEYKSEFSIWCLLAAPLIVVTDIRNMTSAMRDVRLYLMHPKGDEMMQSSLPLDPTQPRHDCCEPGQTW